MDAMKDDGLPALLGTPAQKVYAERIRRSAAAVARYRGDAATLALIRSITDATVYIAADAKRRPLSEFARTSKPPDSPAVARLRQQLSSPWWDARRITMHGPPARLEPPQ
jgi:hypothetical protein